jgi:hypothetical protein
MALKRSFICDEICKKIGLTRKHPKHPHLDKRELLHVNSAMDIIGKDKIKEIQIDEEETHG